MARVDSSQMHIKLQRSRSKGKKCWYPKEEVVTRIASVKYEGCSFNCSKVIAKVKVFFKNGSISKVKVKISKKFINILNGHVTMIVNEYMCEV